MANHINSIDIDRSGLKVNSDTKLNSNQPTMSDHSKFKAFVFGIDAVTSNVRSMVQQCYFYTAYYPLASCPTIFAAG